MEFDNNLYEGLVRRSLMMVKESNEKSWVLALNEKLARIASWRELLADQYSKNNFSRLLLKNIG
jgi:hypothetical protein